MDEDEEDGWEGGAWAVGLISYGNVVEIPSDPPKKGKGNGAVHQSSKAIRYGILLLVFAHILSVPWLFLSPHLSLHILRQIS